MALEQVFKCPRALIRFRSVPLGKLLEDFCKSLLDRGFRRGITRLHVGNVSHLSEHLRRPRGRMRQRVTAGEIEGFFDAYAHLEIDMEMKRRMLEKVPSPAVNHPAPWRKPGILEWLDNLTKATRLCAANPEATTEGRPSTA